ncbi:MAG: hypothetical protein GC181_14025 [Bacteroidetes bacterium]|nr:hypothetical protein [Bacteroidota bacterium]
MNMIMQKTNYEINKSQQNVEMQKKDTIERNKAAKETLISGEDTVAKVYAQLLLNGTEKGTYTGAGDAENDAATMMVQYGTMTYQSTISGGNLNVTVTEIDTDNKLMSGTFNGKLLALYKDLSADSVVEVDGSFTLPFRDTE